MADHEITARYGPRVKYAVYVTVEAMDGPRAGERIMVAVIPSKIIELAKEQHDWSVYHDTEFGIAEVTIEFE